MRNFFIFLLITFVCSVIIYFTGHSLLQSSLENRLKSVPEELEKLGLLIEPISFDNIRVNSSRSLSIKNIKTRLSFSNRQFFSPNESFSISVEDAIFEAIDLSYKKLKLTLNGISIQSIQEDNVETNSSEEFDTNDSIKFEYIVTEFDNESSRPEQATRALLQKFLNFLKTNKLEIPIKFSGHVALNRFGTLKLSLDQDFFIEPKEFEKVAKLNLSAEEIQFLSRRPLRVGTILEIKEQSFDFASKIKVPANPEAVRNIYYILSLKHAFGKNCDEILSPYTSDENKKFHLEMANEYFDKNLGKNGLLKLINEQGKNFPIKAKASITIR